MILQTAGDNISFASFFLSEVREIPSIKIPEKIPTKVQTMFHPIKFKKLPQQGSFSLFIGNYSERGNAHDDKYACVDFAA